MNHQRFLPYYLGTITLVLALGFHQCSQYPPARAVSSTPQTR